MIREEAIKHIENIAPYVGENIKESLNMAIQALGQESCEDCISRQAALDLCERFNGSVPYSVLSSYDALPPVTPQPKIGRWIIIVDDCKHFIAKCSECGKVEDSRMISKYPYCHCGAKMVGVMESEEE